VDIIVVLAVCKCSIKKYQILTLKIFMLYYMDDIYSGRKLYSHVLSKMAITL